MDNTLQIVLVLGPCIDDVGSREEYKNVFIAFIIPCDGSSYTFSIVLPCGEQVNKR